MREHLPSLVVLSGIASSQQAALVGKREEYNARE